MAVQTKPSSVDSKTGQIIMSEKLDALTRTFTLMFASADALEALNSAAIGKVGQPDGAIMDLLLSLNLIYQGDAEQIRRDLTILSQTVGARIEISRGQSAPTRTH